MSHHSRNRNNTGSVALLLIILVAAAALAALAVGLVIYGLVRLTIWTVKEVERRDIARHERRALEWRLRHAMRDVDLRIHKGVYPSAKGGRVPQAGDRIDRYLEARKR